MKKDTIVHEKDFPGVFILDGSVKIRKIDNYNWCIFVKDDNYLDKKKVKPREKGDWIYFHDGYRRYENYFNDIPSAIRWYMKKEWVGDFDGDLKELVDRMEELYGKIASETGNLKLRREDEESDLT